MKQKPAFRAALLSTLWSVSVFTAVPASAGEVSAAAQKPAPTSAARRTGRLPLLVTPSRYDIDVKVDASARRFEGVVETTIDVHARTKIITLNSAGLSLDEVAVMTAGAATGRSRTAAPLHTALDSQAETATFTFADPLDPGVYRLTIRYHGTISTQARSGLYAVDYRTAKGSAPVVMTQFQPADFRRFVPSWDEPDMKSVFALSVTAPAGRMVVSNTQAATRQELPGGWQKVTFVPTPKMSTYLVFLGIGDWERITNRVDGIEVGLVVPKGTANAAAFALSAASQLLSYYNDYFGVKFPLAKLDFICGPGSRGGMENWGAIMMTEGGLLIDPATAGVAEQQAAFGTIAHEMAHLWFGDLVTMSWWDELWLNEGLTTWMEAQATEFLRPQWRPWLQFSANELDGALVRDAQASSRPIVTAVDTAGQTQFDAINYLKGAAVVRMIHAYLGPEAFRAGIRRYMHEHQYGNTSTQDLFTALERASGKSVTQIGEGFVKQAGAPLLVVDQTASGALSVRLERFGVDAPPRSSRDWHVPVTLRASDGQTRQIVVSQSAPQQVTGLRSPVVVNADRLAYARTKYSKRTFAPLLADFARLAAADQLTALSDSWALTSADYAPIDSVLDLLAAVPDAADPLVWSKVALALTEIERYLPAGKERDAFLTFGRGRLAPQLQRLGWDIRSGESDNDAYLRIQLIDALSELGDPTVIAESNQLVAAAGDDPAKLASAKAEAAVRAAGLHADRATFDRLERLARRASDPLTRTKYYEALSSVEDPVLAARALQLSLLEESERLFGGARVVVPVVARRNPDLAWQFAMEHRERLTARLAHIVRYMFFPGIAAQSLKEARAQELASFAERFVPAEGQRDVAAARTQIEQNARLAARLGREIHSWLGRRAAP